MNSLLERLKRGLRDLGQTARDHARTQVDRAADRRDGDAAPERRSETDAPPGSSSSEAANAKPQDAKLPAQQPAPAAASTRLKKAVLSKARRGATPRQAGTVWGASPAASTTGTSWLGGASSPEQPTALLTGANITAAADHDPQTSPNASPATSHGGFFGAPGAHHAAHQEHSLWHSPPAAVTTFGGAQPSEPAPASSLLDGAPAFGRADDAAPPPDRLF
ncbi:MULTISPECIES: hypothetical protein [Piscinibacter]|uniref:hypothetical protein n=1 Tax=Piscinibacter TaxID=1114981 RepID=UPI000FDCDFF5|nr:hypothetical protein [Piscinibacter defluvii]